MPSGAKKRKAAKKKMQEKVHHFVDKVHNFVDNKASHSHSQGSEDPKNHNEEGGKEVDFGKGNVGGEFKNGDRSSSSGSGSGSSSSSDNDEVIVEKEGSAKPETGKLEASSENSGVSEVVNEAVEENIPIEESVKQVVSLPQVSGTVSESQPVDNSSTSHVIEWDLKSDLNEGFQQPFDDEIKVPSGVEKIEEKVTPSKPSSAIVRDDEGLFPQSSGVKASEGCCGDDHCKETQKYAEEQPLLPTAPMPVRRTSWMNCCGLLEVFSGGSSG